MKPHPQSLAQARAIAAYLNQITDSGAGSAINGPDNTNRRLDADETNMLALALEQMRTRVYEVEYPETKVRQLFPIASDIDPGADSFAYEITDYAGDVSVISDDNAGDDPAGVETKSTKVTNGVITIGNGFRYTIHDMRRAAFSGRPLQARKALAQRRVFERGLDRIAAFGAPGEGIAQGICNWATGTGSTQVRSTAMTAASWDATPDAAGMVSDLNRAVSEMIVDSEELHSPNTLILPVAEFLRLSQTYTADNPSVSALDRFLASNGFVKKVVPWNLLKSADGTGTNDARGILLHSNPDVLEVVIPQEFEVLPPQVENYSFKVLAQGRTAGACIYRPLGMRYLTGLPRA